MPCLPVNELSTQLDAVGGRLHPLQLTALWNRAPNWGNSWAQQVGWPSPGFVSSAIISVLHNARSRALLFLFNLLMLGSL